MIEDKLNAIQHYVKSFFSHDVTGHDFFHMRRVSQLAKQIGIKEGADPFICESAGWLHDIGDKKLFIKPQAAVEHLYDFLKTITCTAEEINDIAIAMQDVSFNGGRIPQSIEGKVVQDADRLDAIGAIGIARTFAYGGAKGNMIYHEVDKKHTSIQHFYDKLLTLKDTLNTGTAKSIAHERHLFMEYYLEQFFLEWNQK